MILAGAPFTMKEAMQMLDCSEDTVAELAKCGSLPGLKIGRRWVFPRGAFISALDSQAEEERAARAKPWLAKQAYRARRKGMAALISFHAAKRRAARKQRTPSWADMRAIRAFYEEAHRLTVETGVVHHVDHVIPLQGALVSGLHVQNNLQVLTGAENSRKKNRFEVE